jgi:hypothetical protein
MAGRRDRTKLIERLPEFETRAKATLSALYAVVEDDEWLKVSGQVQPMSGDELEHDVVVNIEAFDRLGRITDKQQEFFYRQGFWKFGTFHTLMRAPGRSLKTVRVYPNIYE